MPEPLSDNFDVGDRQAVRKYYLVNFATKRRVLCLWHRQVIK